MKQVTVTEASKELQISTRRVRELIYSKRLPAKMMGKTWIILWTDLNKVRVRTYGRPKTA